MKIYLTISLVCLTVSVSSQQQLGKAEREAYKETDPARLSFLLTKSCSTQTEKVKAIFSWITDNIAYYRPVAKNRKTKNKVIFFEQEELDDKALPSLTDRVAVKVLQEKTAVCEGYARLFKSLCEHAGIRAEIITGYARTDANKTNANFRSNHTWNAVYIDSSWFLLDVTWASGYISMPSGDFVKYYDSGYFLSSPAKFVQHHYPDDTRWTLLPETPVLGEFRFMPYRQRSYSKYFIKSYLPSKGIIEAVVGDTIRLELQLDLVRRDMGVSPDSLSELLVQQAVPSYVYIKPVAVNGARVTYDFPVDNENKQWLYVMYNEDVLLRYKLNIRKTKESIAAN